MLFNGFLTKHKQPQCKFCVKSKQKFHNKFLPLSSKIIKFLHHLQSNRRQSTSVYKFLIQFSF